MPISPEKARIRGRIAGLKRAVNNGERPADDPSLNNCYRDLAVITVAEKAEAVAVEARKVVSTWPDLTAEQRDRIATILRGSAS